MERKPKVFVITPFNKDLTFANKSSKTSVHFYLRLL